MGKALFYHGILFFTFLVSPTVHETQSLAAPEQDIWDEYNALRIQYTPIDADLAEKSWAFVENHKTAVTVSRMAPSGAIVTNLSFGFPFYDVIISKALAISGLGSISAFVNSSWTIFPLAAAKASSSFIFVDTGDSFHVNWDNFILTNTSHKDAMKFQASLFKNGRIQFIYMKVPQNLAFIAAKSQNDISIGVAHKFVEKFDKGYNQTHHLGQIISMKKFKIQDGTVIRFDPLPSCPKYKDCKSCVNAIVPMDQRHSRHCYWCPEIKRCSSKRDHLQSAWIWGNCKSEEVSDPLSCHAPKPKKETKTEWVPILKLSPIIIIIAALGFASKNPRCFSRTRSIMRSMMVRLRIIKSNTYEISNAEPTFARYADGDVSLIRV
ncbi:Hypothetical predicted protein [Cloeon dipterum]|uniref:PSI domain-containing protein n=1 Tax=Cloeon dipterum TaxID=197152 RepID=A0A8S1DKF6_9INSE|nr:Hypothetical predicted protein [Cloeon dipterum]